MRTSSPSPSASKCSAGADASLDEAADLLAKAKFPVIVSGGGVIFSDGVREAAQLRAGAGTVLVRRVRIASTITEAVMVPVSGDPEERRRLPGHRGCP